MRPLPLCALLLLGTAVLQPIAAMAQSAQDRIESSVTQLPRTAIPRHYSVEVTPDAANLRFAGKVAIDLDVVKPTASLTLNAKDLRFGAVSIQPTGGGAAQLGRAVVNKASETTTLTFPASLPAGH